MSNISTNNSKQNGWPSSSLYKLSATCRQTTPTAWLLSALYPLPLLHISAHKLTWASSGPLRFSPIEPVWVYTIFNFLFPPGSIFHHFHPYIEAGVPPLPFSLSFTLFTFLCLTLWPSLSSPLFLSFFLLYSLQTPHLLQEACKPNFRVMPHFDQVSQLFQPQMSRVIAWEMKKMSVRLPFQIRERRQSQLAECLNIPSRFNFGDTASRQGYLPFNSNFLLQRKLW